MFKKYINLNKLSTLLFYFSILAFIIAFNFAHNPPSGWYQQFMPELNGQILSDVIFLDSLNGFAITDNDLLKDTGYILKTTNGGENWNIIFQDNRDFKAIQFINLKTGYACGAKPFTSSTLLKTTDSGLSWFDIHPPNPDLELNDLTVNNEDTIWVVGSSSFSGGVYRTTNGGVSWDRQLNLGSQNPDHIYMYNGRIGFISEANRYLRKTTNSGLSWNLIPGDNGFRDMYFADSLNGWKCGTEIDSIRATSNGGDIWFKQLLPPTGGFFNLSGITNFTFTGRDTIWGVYARASTALGFRGLIYQSTNGGQTWGYQLPDIKTINIGQYFHIDFVNKNNGWAYSTGSGIHTTTGGDTTFYTSVNQPNIEIPEQFKLYQNYPNPFNPRTKIIYRINKKGFVNLKVYDIKGEEVTILVNQNQNAGEHTVEFDGSNLSSGVYFYRFEFTEDNRNIFTDTKKMILLR